jgi:cytochrome c556
VLLRVPALLTAAGRRAARPRDRASNPEVELETWQLQALLQSKRDDFALRAEKLHDAASIVMRAIDAKDKDALLNGLTGIDLACEGCHVRYWYPNDRRAVQDAKEAAILQ